MCRLGDIIYVENYVTEDGQRIGRHSFVVVEDEKGNISGMEYDFVANVMSSIKNETQKIKKLRYIENLLITSNERVVEEDNGREAFIKADQLYYFDKSKIEYTVIGNVTVEILEQLFELLEELEKKGLIKISINNLETA